MRLERPLDPIEIRILGSLLEKQQATPEYYPMSLNGLKAACNQKTNREPVSEYTEAEIAGALDRLQQFVFVWKVIGSRVIHWEHNLDKKWQLDPPTKAIMTLLLLRGAQTAGEIRSRSDRLHGFESIDEIETSLRRLSEGDEPLVVQLLRRAGQKESRWMHRVAGEAVDRDERPGSLEHTPSSAYDLVWRIERLEERVGELTRELIELKAKLGE